MNFVSKKNIYATSSNVRPNTYIGGIAPTVSTKAMLAAKLSISTTRIKMFRIINDDIQANISGSYIIPTNAFLSSGITYYNDEEGLVTEVGASAFRASLSLEYCIFPNVTVFRGGSATGCFQNCTFLKYVTAPNLLTIQANVFTACSGLLVANYPLLRVIGFGAFQGCASLVALSFPALLTADYYCFRDCTNLKTFSAPLATLIGGTATGWAFRACTSIESIYIPSCTQLTTPADNSNFANIRLGCVITVNIALMTNNGGLPDADLTYAAGTRQAIINYPTAETLEINTKIGGLAATVNTRELLAAKLGLNTARVPKFVISGADVECTVIGTYALPAAAFKLNTAITYFDDKNSLVTSSGIEAFREAPALVDVTLNGLVIAAASMFYNTPALQTFSLNACTTLNASVFYLSGIPSISLPNVTTLVGTMQFREMPNCKTFNLPLLGRFSNQMFRYSAATENINAPSCTQIGDSVNADFVFENIKTGTTITVKKVLETVNAGAPDGDLVYAAGTRGATIVYIP